MARKVAVVKNPKTVGEAMRRAAEILGPAIFCPECYGWTNTWHITCPFPMGRVFAPAVATLAGGLDADPECLCIPTLDEVHPACPAHTLEAAEVAS